VPVKEIILLCAVVFFIGKLYCYVFYIGTIFLKILNAVNIILRNVSSPIIKYISKYIFSVNKMIILFCHTYIGTVEAAGRNSTTDLITL